LRLAQLPEQERAESGHAQGALLFPFGRLAFGGAGDGLGFGGAIVLTPLTRFVPLAPDVPETATQLLQWVTCLQFLIAPPLLSHCVKTHLSQLY
jgi:hypothetical protein